VVAKFTTFIKLIYTSVPHYLHRPELTLVNAVRIIQLKTPIKVTEVNEMLTLIFPHLLKTRSSRQLTTSGRDKYNLMIFTYIPCNLIFIKVFFHQQMHNWIILKTILNLH